VIGISIRNEDLIVERERTLVVIEIKAYKFLS